MHLQAQRRNGLQAGLELAQIREVDAQVPLETHTVDRLDLATPYFASKYVVERLELDETISRNLSLAVYPGGHMFYLRADARIQSYLDTKALYEAAAVPPAR